MNQETIIKELRSWMKAENTDFLLLNATDEYLNEYISLEENSRYYITGFTGSTGDVLVTQNNVYLFVDGRYHLQSDDECNKKIITVVKVGIDKSLQAAIIETILELSESNQSLGIVSCKISFSSFKNLKKAVLEKEIRIKEFDLDPVEKFYKNNDTAQTTKLRAISEEISGVAAAKKLQQVINKLSEQDLNALILTKLEEIAYLTNLRGNEIPFSSSFKSKAIIYNGKCTIFCEPEKISEEIKSDLKGSFEFEKSELFNEYLKSLSDKRQINVAFNPVSCNLLTYRQLESIGFNLVEIDLTPIAEMKSVKNPAEIRHMQECFRKTDIVVSRAITWLNQNLEKGVKVSEKDLAEKVKQLFCEEGAFSLSFGVIAASGRNTAFIHYTNPNPEKQIQNGELVLLDCGGYFEGGYATDITRTFLAGNTDKDLSKEKEVYTRVLKAFLNALHCLITKNTTGFDVDKKARDIIDEFEDKAFKFAHGTGHGVGIAVHEAPPRISPAEASRTELKEGMVFTIEPGIYNCDWGGVRLENTVTVVKENNQLKIKTLGRKSFDEKLIDYNLLSKQETKWLKDYQKKALG